VNLFLDTNVVIDYLADRHPFSEAAAELFQHSEQENVSLFISAVSYNNIYYILRQSLTNAATIKVLDELSDITKIVEVNSAIIKKSLKADFKDFEDAIQYNCALTIPKLKAIITRNEKDFKKSTVSVFSPVEILTIINGEK
jgi:predicted nucleic acid-binding protein